MEIEALISLIRERCPTAKIEKLSPPPTLSKEGYRVLTPRVSVDIYVSDEDYYFLPNTTSPAGPVFYVFPKLASSDELSIHEWTDNLETQILAKL